MEKLTITVREMGRQLGISHPKAYELTKRAGFPCIRIGQRKVIPVEGLKKWLEAQVNRPISEISS